MLLRVAAPLVQAVQAFETFGFAPFQARFNARDALRDRAVVLSDGTTGTAHGASEAGALLVHTAARHEVRHQFRSERAARRLKLIRCCA